MQIDMKHYITLLLLALLVVGQMTAQVVRISGKVYDEQDSPVEFATVRILGTNVGVNTDLNGYYELSVAPADTIMVEFSCIGYSTVTRQLIKPTGTVTLKKGAMLKCAKVSAIKNLENKGGKVAEEQK